MSFKVEHKYRFDSAGKLDADDWVLIPRAQLRAGFVLDDALADDMAERYFKIVSASSMVPLKIIQDAQGVRYLAPLNKTAILLAEPERITDAQRVETSWQITGGFLLAHRVNYGGRFYIGAEWDKPDTLKLYSSIRRYPPRLTHWLSIFGAPTSVALYNRTQGFVHQQTEEKFLRAVADHLTRSTL